MSQLPDWYDRLPKGWRRIFTRLDGELLLVDPDYDVVQAKQKFGGLRVYLNHAGKGSAVIHECNRLIDQAEAVAFKTCEDCGSAAPEGPRQVPGYKMPWYKTQCDSCRDGMTGMRNYGQPEAG